MQCTLPVLPPRGRGGPPCAPSCAPPAVTAALAVHNAAAPAAGEQRCAACLRCRCRQQSRGMRPGLVAAPCCTGPRACANQRASGRAARWPGPRAGSHPAREAGGGTSQVPAAAHAGCQRGLGRSAGQRVRVDTYVAGLRAGSLRHVKVFCSKQCYVEHGSMVGPAGRPSSRGRGMACKAPLRRPCGRRLRERNWTTCRRSNSEGRSTRGLRHSRAQRSCQQGQAEYTY